MRVRIYCVGRMKSGPERELADRYCDRFSKTGPALGLEFGGIIEIPESPARAADARKSDEATRLLDRIDKDAVIIVLDERGKSLTSETFASRLANLRDDGNRDLALIIGGPDGHGPELLNRAYLRLCFGALTWPHQLVRVLLAEQLYRAATILAGHPYHRS